MNSCIEVIIIILSDPKAMYSATVPLYLSENKGNRK